MSGFASARDRALSSCVRKNRVAKLGISKQILYSTSALMPVIGIATLGAMALPGAAYAQDVGGGDGGYAAQAGVRFGF